MIDPVEHAESFASVLRRICITLALACLLIVVCASGAQAAKPACSDGKDNDGDGKIDLADPGCTSKQDNNETDIVTPPPPAYDVLVSKSADRSAPTPLDATTQSGTIYAFTAPDTNVQSVAFYLDGSFVRTESVAPFDFGGGSVSVANPFDTKALADGSHSIQATLAKTDGTTTQDTDTFTVANGTQPPGGPITITQGGTYSGNWTSTDPNVPAVKVSTSAPVTIQDCTLQSKGNLIEADFGSKNITVRRCSGYATNPNVAGQFPGRFLHAEEFANIVLENNYMEGTSGVYVRKYTGDGSASNSIKVRYNKAKNIDGRKSDGAGGYRTGNTDNDFYRVQFLQFNDVRSVPGVDIGWNEVINEPYKSRVEDVISMYISAGTSANPYLIHDNYIQGAYPAQPNTQTFSGGGIMLGDGGSTTSNVPAFIRAYNNQVVSTDNYGLAIANGHDNYYYNNKVVNACELSDGTKISACNVGAYVWNASGAPSTVWFNNSATGNVIGSEKADGTRNDWWFPNCSDCSGNSSIPGDITRAMEAQEYTNWQSKLSANGVTLGAP